MDHLSRRVKLRSVVSAVARHMCDGCSKLPPAVLAKFKDAVSINKLSFICDVCQQNLQGIRVNHESNLTIQGLSNIIGKQANVLETLVQRFETSMELIGMLAQKVIGLESVCMSIAEKLGNKADTGDIALLIDEVHSLGDSLLPSNTFHHLLLPLHSGDHQICFQQISKSSWTSN